MCRLFRQVIIQSGKEGQKMVQISFSLKSTKARKTVLMHQIKSSAGETLSTNRSLVSKIFRFSDARNSIFAIQHRLMFEVLFKNLDEKIRLTEEEKDLCKSFFTPKKLRKRQYILQEGDVCKYIAFVEKGMLRAYTVDDKGNDHIIQFAFEGWWISDQFSFLTGEPAVYNIDALEESQLLLLSRQAEEQLMERIPKFERYFRLLLQNSLIAMQRRLIGSLSQSAEERYNQLITGCPTIPQRVPQHMMASFLGITPETLSRIRRQAAHSK